MSDLLRSLLTKERQEQFALLQELITLSLTKTSDSLKNRCANSQPCCWGVSPLENGALSPPLPSPSLSFSLSLYLVMINLDREIAVVGLFGDEKVETEKFGNNLLSITVKNREIIDREGNCREEGNENDENDKRMWK